MKEQKWICYNAENHNQYTTGTADECHKWVVENGIKSTLMAEINEETDSPKTLGDMIAEGRITEIDEE